MVKRSQYYIQRASDEHIQGFQQIQHVVNELFLLMLKIKIL